MVSQCANPKCRAPFLYLHEGKLVAISHPAELPEESRVELYWLCAECCKRMNPDGATNLVPRLQLEAH
jgi:hypothetical protein